MINHRHSQVSFAALVLVLCTLASCTYTRIPSKIWLSRAGDTLTVALDQEAEARWNPESDSLVVVCEGCEEGRERAVEHFYDRDFARYEIAHTQGLSLTLYSSGHKDTVFVVSGEGVRDTSEPAPTIRRIPRHHRAADVVDNSEAPTPTKKVKGKEVTKEVVKDAPSVKETPATPTEKTIIKPTMLKVTATEGVAIYKDKSKKEVLKIVPAGSVLQLISHEGDMYSVAVGDGEGFVEAEAVQVQ